MLDVSVTDLSPRLAPENAPRRKGRGPGHRILIVLHDFSGGGTERVAIRLANQWARMGRAVRIFCGTEAGPLRGLVDDAVSVEQADPVLPRARFSRIRLGIALARAAETLPRGRGVRTRQLPLPGDGRPSRGPTGRVL